ncbi:MAG: class I SAM-dependent methyltransferase, partial [Methylophilaceae bacterium]
LFTANFNEASFDIINLCHVIEHVPKPKLLFEEISRILKPGGLLIVKTPNSKALGRALFNTNWFANEVPRHLYLFSERNLLMMGEECQLELITINTSSTPKIILNSIDYVLNNNKKPSKKIWWRRLLVKPYIFLAKYKNQGDEIHAILKKI